MRCGSCCWVLGMVLVCGSGLRAGEPVAKEDEKKAAPTTEERVAALERQVTALLQAMVEKDNKIAELQRQVGELAQRQPATGMPGLQFRGTPREMEEMMRNFRRDFFRDDPDFLIPDLGAGNEFQIPWEREAPLPRQRQPELQAQPKPRLGVSLEDPTPDLADRFQNEVKTGAFVTLVLPGTPAAKAGLMAGDCITAFDKRPVLDAQELIRVIQAAAMGKHELTLKRRGEELVLSVQLGEAPQNGALPARPRIENGWLKRGPDAGGAREVLVVRASALELTPQLAEKMKLTNEQRRKMEEVLARQARQLSAEYTAKGGAGRGLTNNTDPNPLVEQHAALAEKELTGVLDEQQLQTWREYRRRNNRLSVSRSLEVEQKVEPEGLNF